MESIAGFSDSNEISNNCSSSGVVTAANVVTSFSHTSDVSTGADVSTLQLLSTNLESLFESPDSFFSDATLVLASGREVSVHRCLLSSRSPFFRSKFLSAEGSVGGGGGTVVKLEVKELAGEYDVGFDSLVAVLGYVYSGRERRPPKEVCSCADDECIHIGCRPAVDFMVEVLYLAFTFQLPELVALYQRRLLEILYDVAPDEIMVILSVANICEKGCKKLSDSCIEIIVKSDVDVVTLGKSLPQQIVEHIMDMRLQRGLKIPVLDKYVKKIHGALDSHDIELVKLLLEDGHANLDDANALHYAVLYCDAKTTTELLDLGFADINRRNSRGYTVLHVAAMRKEPMLLLSLLTKGARPMDTTPDGRKPVQISRRLTRAGDYHKSTEEGKACLKERLCIEILEHAERGDQQLGEAFVSPTMTRDELTEKLLYLENRVALARLLFPMEAQVAMDIAKVPGTSEFKLAERLVGAETTPIGLHEASLEGQLIRLRALSRTVELGKRFFPRCSEVLNKIMDADDLSQLACIENDTPEERVLKRKRYMELQEDLSKAFDEDREDNSKSVISSSSSSTSKAIGMMRSNKKLIGHSR